MFYFWDTFNCEKVLSITLKILSFGKTVEVKFVLKITGTQNYFFFFFF